jgi:hypothetical protein
MGNKIEKVEKKVKLTSAELRKKKKGEYCQPFGIKHETNKLTDRMARRKRGEEVFSDEE